MALYFATTALAANQPLNVVNDASQNIAGNAPNVDGAFTNLNEVNGSLTEGRVVNIYANVGGSVFGAAIHFNAGQDVFANRNLVTVYRGVMDYVTGG
jgi:hypothetical protein